MRTAGFYWKEDHLKNCFTVSEYLQVINLSLFISTNAIPVTATNTVDQQYCCKGRKDTIMTVAI